MATIFILFCLLGLTSASKLRDVNGEYGTVVEVPVDIEHQFNYLFPDSNTANPYRVHIWSENSEADHPILVVVKQEKGVTAWQIPLLVESSNTIGEYRNTSRTLCYDPPGTRNAESVKKNFTINISTSSPNPVNVAFIVNPVETYFIRNEDEFNATFSTSQPIFFDYNSPAQSENIKTVKVLVDSKKSSCFTVSVQEKTCPVHDLNEDISYKGKYQTVKTKGGLIIPLEQYTGGFFLVMVAKSDDHDCTQEDSLLPFPENDRVVKNVTMTNVTVQIKLEKSRNEYIEATMVVLASNLGACLLLMLMTFLFYWFGRYKKVEIYEEPKTKILALSAEDFNEYYKKTDLTVSDFVKKGERNRKQGLNYLWHISNIAIFYGLPVVQLMVSYQRLVDNSGNLNICYHNFYCSHPYYINDFNHVYSNIGYLIFGVLFLCTTLFRDKKIRNKPGCGIPKLHGLYYAMGLALVFEGVFSACYHICPNQSNFQFDTSFMYVMAVLIMVKLYQNRHPDINASAYATFNILGFIVVIVMFGILFNNMTIMVIFILCYIALCLYISFKIYFFGFVIKGIRLMIDAYRNEEPIGDIIKPIRLTKFIMLTIVNLCNMAIAITGLVLYPNRVDFGTFLLGILLLNAVMYSLFYMIMKLNCHEKVCIEAIVHGILGLVSWGFGCYFFINASSKWMLTPAESRAMNTDCIFMNFYDSHDIWHLISAPALYFTFMFLLALDDDLYDKPRDKIVAF